MKTVFNVIIFVVIFVLSLPLILCILIGYLWHLNSKVVKENMSYLMDIIIGIMFDDDHL